MSSTAGSDGSPPSPGSARISFERLRERTDELELLISGLTMLALFSLPGLLWEAYEHWYSQLPLVALATVVMALPMATLVCYFLASCFALHLAIRAFWVGLIGLKAAFPQGIRWSAATGSGPLARERMQRELPQIDLSIERADRAAAVLFSLITLSGLTLLWLSFLMTLVFAVSGWIGQRMGATNAVIELGISVFMVLMYGSVLLQWLLDAVIARWLPPLTRSPLYRGLVWPLAKVAGLFFPSRLIAPVRLTLQTNTRPWLFLLVFIGIVVVLPAFAVRQFQASLSFDRFGTQRFLLTQDVADGARSAHYESRRISRNRLRAVPLIPAPVIETAWLPLFLPYQPLLDDPLIEQRCPERLSEPAQPKAAPTAQRASGERRRDAVACFARLWKVSLNGVAVSLDGFFPSERADLGLRGMEGFVDLRASQPGPQQLEVQWRPDPRPEELSDDLVTLDTLRFSIPFLWSPEAAVELPVQ